MQLRRIWKTVTRKKPLTTSLLEESDLPRVLGLFDLTALGVASTLGMGVYIMVGSIAKIAGPASTLSFFVAGVAAALSALCYSEFAARVPKAGSAYVYSYVAVGEIVAFVVGWNVALEYVIGAACVARGLSNYIDSLFDSKISIYLSSSMPLDFPYLSSYPDFFSFIIMIGFSGLLAFGVVLSSNFNKAFTTVNLTTIIIIVLAGAYKANWRNWSISPNEVPADREGGSGGFMPFGFVGIFNGAAKCFYAYTGFDCVATTGEEAKNPQRNVPLALILTLLIAFVAYLGISASLTFMWPYYDQSITAPFPYAFEKTHLTGVKYVVSTGALCALCACMVGSLYAASRILYSMACDGLLFQCLSYVHIRLQTPLVAISAIGLFTGIVSIFFDMEMLVDMTSIGTLMAYTIVSICVLLLRYETQTDTSVEEQITKLSVVDESVIPGILNGKEHDGVKHNLFKILFNADFPSVYYRINVIPTNTTSTIVKWMTCTLLTSLTTFCGCFTMASSLLFEFDLAILFLLSISAAVGLLSALIISRQPQSKENLHFKVRFVPLIPICSCLMNISLMLMLNLQTWIRFIVWMGLGFLIYFGYGVTHSKENLKHRNSRKLNIEEKCSSSSSKHINEITDFT